MVKGERVIAIKTVKAGDHVLLKKGESYPILGVRTLCCISMLDVGASIKKGRINVICKSCGSSSARKNILFPKDHFKKGDALQTHLDKIERDVKEYLSAERRKVRAQKKKN